MKFYYSHLNLKIELIKLWIMLFFIMKNDKSTQYIKLTAVCKNVDVLIPLEWEGFVFYPCGCRDSGSCGRFGWENGLSNPKDKLLSRRKLSAANNEPRGHLFSYFYGAWTFSLLIFWKLHFSHIYWFGAGRFKKIMYLQLFFSRLWFNV